ncbi:MlaD family protein [Iamia majanohamensis]|uniref:MlaD family protein n=1 Tax=Iamia majanohamensis TaxID=467976 RepID=A0AAE9Y697_9ACTN|nr:MlaD family protein [Iamia majanohamensis]WCO65009.1 MlaD family protein [Iamia majanohamensis]
MAGRDAVSKGHRAVAALAVACLVTAGVTVGVRAAYGAFDDSMEVTGTFARAGQSLKEGSDVLYRGVPVGEVDDVELVGQEVRLTLALEQDRRVPTDVEAVIAPKTLFGEKSVELRGGRPAGGPYLTDGAELADTRAGLEVEELIAAADPVLRGIDTTELARLTTSLTQVLQGEGRRINRALEPTVAAAGLLEDTIDAQLRLLDANARFAEELRTIGPDVNGAGEQLNLLLPTLNQARGDYVRFLRTLGPLADDVADLLVTVRPDLDRLLVDGGNVTRVLLAREDDISATVRGLATYFQTFAEGISAETFDDGSKAAFFKVFVVFDDLSDILCAIVDPGVALPPELRSVLGTIGGGLLEGSGLIDCGGAGEGADGAVPGAPTGPLPPLDELAQPYLGATAAPDPSAPTGLGAVVDPALGGPG